MSSETALLVLIILDGWGIAPPSPGNTLSLAKIPNFTRLSHAYPHTQLFASGHYVGLADGEPGNSEVGHLTIGAGTTIFQDISRIDLAIADQTFFKNEAFLNACRFAKENKSNLHLLGLFGTGKVHSSKEHLYSLLKIALQEGLGKNQVKVHVFTDGRDSLPTAGQTLIKELQSKTKELNIGQIVSVTGRYFAMDRDRRWDRTEKTYRLLTEGIGETAKSGDEVFSLNYKKNITDEFIPPTLIKDSVEPNNGLTKDNDALIFFNFRTDRMRQLTQAIIKEDFYSFERTVRPKNLFIVTMTEFEKDLPVSNVAFKPHANDFALPRLLSALGKKQLHIAETEKYAFVTYYFNGLYEKAVPGEKRVVVPSKKVAIYDLTPEMSAFEITEAFKNEVKLDDYNFVIINFANPDMLGHTGNIQAAVKGCEVVDQCLKEVVNTTLSLNGACIITADHGNVEEMINPKTGEVSTSHSTNPVPLILVGKPFLNLPRNLTNGTLADIAPTILKILNLNIPSTMKGKPLLK